MIIDASALSAILLNEPERLDLLNRLSTASRRVTSGIVKGYGCRPITDAATCTGRRPEASREPAGR
jgi:uncharacterized protein with PIN domain